MELQVQLNKEREQGYILKERMNKGSSTDLVDDNRMREY
jgi:hypothetical protein